MREVKRLGALSLRSEQSGAPAEVLVQVTARDTSGAHGRARAAVEVQCCADILEAFAHEIYERQAEVDTGIRS